MCKMDNHVKHIIEDLLPLYQEGLLSKESKEWLEAQLEENPAYQELLEKMRHTLEKEDTPEISAPEQEKMFKRIHRKLTIYQFIFTGIAFFLAMQTALLNESFGFILWYAVLGFVVYLFYADMRIVFLLSFVPIFIWSVVMEVSSFMNGAYEGAESFFSVGFDVVVTAVVLSFIHFFFALIGSVIALILKKLKTEGTQ